MTNKPTYMKRIIAGSSLLFSILLATPQAYAQESVDVIIRENGTERREVIDLPKSMTYPVDSLLSDWKAKNYIDLGKDCSHILFLLRLFFQTTPLPKKCPFSNAWIKCVNIRWTAF